MGMRRGGAGREYEEVGEEVYASDDPVAESGREGEGGDWERNSRGGVGGGWVSEELGDVGCEGWRDG